MHEIGIGKHGSTLPSQGAELTPFAAELISLLPRLRRYATTLTRSASEAEDLAQACCERALRAQAQWHDGTRPDAWVFRIARNLWIDQLRKRRREGASEALDAHPDLPGEDGRQVTETALTADSVQAGADGVAGRTARVAAARLRRRPELSRRLEPALDPDRNRDEPPVTGAPRAGEKTGNGTDMTNLAVSDEELVARADGELPEVEAERLHARIVADPELAERFAILAETRMLLEADPAGAQAAPDRLAAVIAASGRPLAPQRPRLSVIAGSAPAASDTPSSAPRRWPRLAMPLAASFLFLAGGLAGYLSAGGGLQPDVGIAVTGMSRPGISAALSRAASGSEVALQGGSLRVIASHKLENGRICREYTLARAAGGASWDAVDCRIDNDWRTELLAARAAPVAGYAPASGDASIDAFLNERGAEPLSSEEERKFLVPAP